MNKYLIVLLFAILHFVLAFSSTLVGYEVLLVLTLMTMLMSLLLSIRQEMGTVFMVVAVIVINFAGLYLGQWIGVMVRKYIILESTPYRHYLAGPLSTFITTGILGTAQILIADTIRKTRFYKGPETEQNSMPVVIAFVVVLVIRLIMMMRSSKSFFGEYLSLNIILDYAGTAVVILWMAYHVIKAQRDYKQEKRKRHEAQYSYDRLKTQIEPHFLFNSLNTLSSIVDTGNNQDAKLFIQKLSAIYRYLLDTEDEHLVFLSEELQFVDQYASLMRIRFPEGLSFQVEIGREAQNRYVIPCSIQLLVENAIKHNVVSAREPLCIRISIEGDYLVVSNNLNPKLTSQPSTGNGQRYIRQRYHDEVEREVIIEKSQSEYIVKLPLL
ncbi:MAG: histidine kinase [Bacteroidales bacterium]|nr:histidine kinase [Bacteroidales bacterium]